MLKMLPESFKQLKRLQYLNLHDCSNLTFTEHNADILENMTKLEYLNFEGCKGLQVLPHHITKQAFLRELHLKETSLSELPNNIGQLQRLEVLSIGSEELESLPDSLGNLSSLTCLEIVSCRKVGSLPESLGRLALLESIDMGATGVESLPKAFGHLISLQKLTIWDSPIRELIFEFEESSSLRRLKSILLSETSMSTISIPEDFFPNLERLSVNGDSFLVEIRTLPRTVKTLTLTNCGRLKNIAGIRSLQNLQYLAIKSCPELAELPSFAEFASVKEIEIRECQISAKMEGLEQLTSLETLEVETQWEVPGITSLEYAQGLRRLGLSAEKIGAVEPCIKTLQKLPGEVRIFARALDGVESVVKAFTSSNLIVVEGCADGGDGAHRKHRNDEADVYDEDSEDEGDEEADVYDEDAEDEGDEEADEDVKYRKTYWPVQSHPGWTGWRLRDPWIFLSDEATIFCIVIKCLSQHAWLRVLVCRTHTLLRALRLRKGKWVWICAVSKGILKESHLQIDFHGEGNKRVEKALIGSGEQSEVKDVFYKVLEALKM